MRCEFPGELVKMERFRDLGGREVAGVSEIWEMVSEVMGDAIDDALEGDEEEEETEELVSQVLDEIGIDINQELVNAPSAAVSAPAAKGKVAQAEATGNDDGGIDSDLQARLDNLRRM